MNTLINDIKYAIRRLSNNPCFTIIAVLTLGLGIGANTAIFSTIDAILLQPLPYDKPDRLVMMNETLPNGNDHTYSSGGAFLDWKSHTNLFEYVAMSGRVDFNLTGIDRPERVHGLEVTADFLRVLGVDPILGRGFAPDEDQMGSNNLVAVLNHDYWKLRFGGDPDVVGKVIMLDNYPVTIIGVLPPNRIMFLDYTMKYDNDIALLVPAVINPQIGKWQRHANWGRAIGRLKPGVSVNQAHVEFRSFREQEEIKLAYKASDKENWNVSITSFNETCFPSKARSTLVLLLGATAMVLLIACANVANLLLARGNARQKEMAVRAALGASSWRIIRQILLESLVLAFIGGLLGIIIAAWGIDLPARTVTGLFPEIRHPELNIRMLLFSIGVACGCGLLFGTLPALKACKIDCNSVLKEGGRSGTSGSAAHSQSLLVVSEVTFTVLLLIGAGLFLRSFSHILDVDPGFNPGKTLAFDLRFTYDKYPNREDRSRFINNLVEQIRVIPSVTSTAAAMELPLSKDALQGRGEIKYVNRADRPEPDYNNNDDLYLAGCNFVTGDYFTVTETTLIHGRALTEADNRNDATPVIVIDSRVANDLYPNEDPLGQRIRMFGRTWEIVGIAAPVRHFGLDADPTPRVYIAQSYDYDLGRTSFIARTTAPPLSLVQAVRKTVFTADPDLPIFNIRTLEQAIQGSVTKKRTMLILLGCLAAVAVSLACMGLYGFMSYFVGQRTRELCIRSALGARRLDIIKQVVSVGMKLSTIGIIIGLITALALARLIESQLFEIKTHDPLVYIVSIGLICLVAFLSVYLPARRVAKIDPMEVLRYE